MNIKKIFTLLTLVVIGFFSNTIKKFDKDSVIQSASDDFDIHVALADTPPDPPETGG